MGLCPQRYAVCGVRKPLPSCQAVTNLGTLMGPFVLELYGEVTVSGWPAQRGLSSFWVLSPQVRKGPLPVPMCQMLGVRLHVALRGSIYGMERGNSWKSIGCT